MEERAEGPSTEEPVSITRLVVRYAIRGSGEDEQARRAVRLEQLGLVRVVPAGDLTPDHLVDEVVLALATTQPAARLDLRGRERSAQIVADLLRARAAARMSR